MKAPPQPRKKPLQQRSQQMVETIIEATARVLIKNGYAKTNTNLIAERAGIGVGSVYQYFPNKDALIVALHERHLQQMHHVIDESLSGPKKTTPQKYIAAIVRALLTAHLIEPDLHKILEKELHFLTSANTESQSEQNIFRLLRQLLEELRMQIAPTNLDLAVWVVKQIIVSMVHAVVIEQPKQFAVDEIEQAITDAVMGYLLGARATE
jgi:AcrR family transcriptional regulator